MIKLLNNDIMNIALEDLPKPNLILTSPPYNVQLQYDIYKDNLSYNEYMKWNKKWIYKLYKILPDDGRFCLNVPLTISPETKDENDEWINHPVTADYTRICMEVGFKYWRTIIWEKNISNSTGWGSWRSAKAPFMRDPSEAIIVMYKHRWERNNSGESTISGPEFMSYTKNVWQMRPETQSDHPAAFPIELPNRCLKLFSFKGDWVFDPFMGSGTVGEAAMRLGRNFVGVELSPDYFSEAEDRVASAELQTRLHKELFPGGDEVYEEDLDPEKI